jgi:hypothetical protein
MDCKFCDKVAAGSEPAGGWVLRNDLVSASVIDGTEVPGWYVSELGRALLTQIVHAEARCIDQAAAYEMAAAVAALVGGAS